MSRVTITVVNGGNMFIDIGYGVEEFHPWILTSFLVVASWSGSSATATFRSYPKAIDFADGISKSDVTFNNNGNGDLQAKIWDNGSVVHSFTIDGFEDGFAIQGFGTVNPDGTFDVGEFDDEAGGFEFEALPPGAGSISYAITSDSFYEFQQNVLVRYFFQQFIFDDGTLNVRGGVPIVGTGGSDSLRGFDVDSENGQAFNDTLNGKGGDDSLRGGLGSDTYKFSNGFGFDYVYETGTDTDKLVFDATIDPDNVVFRRSGINLEIEVLDPDTGNSTDDTVVLSSHYASDGTVNTSGVIETLEFEFGDGYSVDLTGALTFAAYSSDNAHTQNPNGTAYDDILIGSSANNDFEGLAGNDVYKFSAGFGWDRPFEVGDGTDKLVFDATIDPDNVVFRRSGINLEIEVLDPDTGNSTDDTVVLSSHYASDGTVNTSGVIETLEFEFGDGYSVDLTGALTFAAYSSDNAHTQNPNGTAYDDILIGSSANNDFEGLAGNDVYKFSAGFGWDRPFEVGDGTDKLVFDATIDPDNVVFRRSGINLEIEVLDPDTGNSTDDTVVLSSHYASDGTVNTSGVIETLEFEFGDGYSVDLTGALTFAAYSSDNAHTQNPNGTAYDDILIGSSANNDFEGLAGNDVYKFSAGFGWDRPFEVGDGTDKLVFDATIDPDNVVFRRSGINLEIEVLDPDTGNSTDDTVVLSSHYASDGTVNTSGVIETLEFEFEFGDGYSVDLTGALTFAAYSSDNAHTQNPNGTAYDDILIGSSANNDFEGLAGNDVYKFSAGFGWDRPFEVGDGTDKLVFDATIDPDNVVFRRSGINLEIEVLDPDTGNSTDDTVVLPSHYASDGTVNTSGVIETLEFEFGDGYSVDLTGALTFAAYSSDNAHTQNPNGTAYDDVLIGSSTNNSLDGKAGEDTAVFTGNLGDYTIERTGSDSFRVTDNRAGSPDGIDFIYNVELLVFADAPDGVAPAAIDLANDAPTLALPSSPTVLEDSTANPVPGITVSDIDSASLTVTLVATSTMSLGETAGLSFTVGNDATDEETMSFSGSVADINAALATLTYTPTPDEDGDGSITVTVDDGTAPAVEQVLSIGITPENEPPIVDEGIANQAIDEYTPWTFVVPADAFDDADGDPLSLSATRADDGPLPDWLSFDPATRTFTGTPPQDFTGSVGLKVTADDGNEPVDTTFDLVVNPVNDAPRIVLPSSPTVLEDSSDNPVTGISVSDVDTDTLTVTLVATSTISLTETAGLSFSIGNDATDETTMRFAGSVSAINAALATLTYTPAPDEDGDGSITVTVDDGMSAAVDEVLAIGITPVNDALTITSNGGGATTTISVAENTTGITTVTASDVDGPTPTFTIVGGTDQGLFDIGGNTGTLTFKTDPDFEAPGDSNKDNTYSVIVQASDGTSTDTQALNVAVTNVTGVSLTGSKKADTLTGTGEEDTLNGRNGKDTLKGLAGNDVLDGGRHKDKLTGGDGADAFIFADKLKNKWADTITDFEVNEDTIQLDKSVFKKIGNSLSKKEFEIGKKADDKNDRIIYDNKSGKLFHDANGDKSGKQKLFAILDKKLKLDHNDFDMIA